MHCGLHVLADKPLAVHGQKNYVRWRHTAIQAAPGVMFQERSLPLYMKIKSMLQEGMLGDIRRVHWIVTDWFRSQAYYQSSPWRATWKGEGGGLLINQCPHNLDLFYWFMGLPERVTAHIDLGKYHPIEVEDEVHAFLAYPNGSSGVFVANTGEAPGTNRLEIVGEKGTLVLEQAHSPGLRMPLIRRSSAAPHRNCLPGQPA